MSNYEAKIDYSKLDLDPEVRRMFEEMDNIDYLFENFGVLGPAPEVPKLDYEIAADQFAWTLTKRRAPRCTVRFPELQDPWETNWEQVIC